MKMRLPARKAILERRTYESPAEGRRGKIRLDFNENTTGCSEAALAAVRGVSGANEGFGAVFRSEARGAGAHQWRR